MDFLAKYNININNKDLLMVALTHTSYAYEHKCESYERLEFLGDAVLQLIVSEYLYNNYDYKEGEMTKIRASFVCEDALYNYAQEIGYIPYIRAGHGQIGNVNETIIADIFEAILGCIFLDLGFNKAKEYIYQTVIPNIKEGKIYLSDYKSALQEMTQMNKTTLEYVLVNEYGAPHDKTFEVEVKIGNIVYGKGIGKSKKEAEQRAAKDAFKKCASK